MAHWMDDPKHLRSKTKCARSYSQNIVKPNMRKASKRIKNKQQTSLRSRDKKVTLPKFDFKD